TNKADTPNPTITARQKTLRRFSVTSANDDPHQTEDENETEEEEHEGSDGEEEEGDEYAEPEKKEGRELRKRKRDAGKEEEGGKDGGERKRGVKRFRKGVSPKKERGQKEATEESTGLDPLLQDPFRIAARTKFEETFTTIFNTYLSNPSLYGPTCTPHHSIPIHDPQSFAHQIETALYEAHKSPTSNLISPKYKERYRMLQFNLRDKTNDRLRRRVLSGEVGVEELVKLEGRELASEEGVRRVEEARAEGVRRVDLRRKGEEVGEGSFEVEGAVRFDGGSGGERGEEGDGEVGAAFDEMLREI
ncbi:hypothetical protein HK097_006563, partial [Rhizophlyctis rosea]